MKNPSSCSCFESPLLSVLQSRAHAEANITGSGEFPNLSGSVRFYQTNKGVVVCAEISGLPKENLPCREQIFGFHIHNGTSCSGNMEDPFADTLSHYDSNSCAHPDHAGDLPPLFGNNGLAISAFLTNRFSLESVIGKTVVIHAQPDDFKTQPSGNSGAKIACGVIRRVTGSCR